MARAAGGGAVARAAWWGLLAWSLFILIMVIVRFVQTTLPLNPPPGYHHQEWTAAQSLRALIYWGRWWPLPALILYLIHYFLRPPELEEEEIWEEDEA